MNDRDRFLNPPENWNVIPFPNIWKEGELSKYQAGIDLAKDDSTVAVVTVFKSSNQLLLDQFGNFKQVTQYESKTT